MKIGSEFQMDNNECNFLTETEIVRIALKKSSFSGLAENVGKASLFRGGKARGDHKCQSVKF